MSAAKALADVLERNGDEAPAPAADIPLGPGVRIVDGLPMYSAAWIDFEQPPAR